MKHRKHRKKVKAVRKAKPVRTAKRGYHRGPKRGYHRKVKAARRVVAPPPAPKSIKPVKRVRKRRKARKATPKSAVRQTSLNYLLRRRKPARKRPISYVGIRTGAGVTVCKVQDSRLQKIGTMGARQLKAWCAKNGVKIR